MALTRNNLNDSRISAHHADQSQGSNFKVNLKILGKSTTFLKINYQQNYVQICDIYVPQQQFPKFTFDRVFNEYVSL